MLVCGDKEMETGEVSVRTRRGNDLGSINVSEFKDALLEEIRSRRLEEQPEE